MSAQDHLSPHQFKHPKLREVGGALAMTAVLGGGVVAHVPFDSDHAFRGAYGVAYKKPPVGQRSDERDAYTTASSKIRGQKVTAEWNSSNAQLGHTESHLDIM